MIKGDLVTCPTMQYMGEMTIINVIEKRTPEYIARGSKTALVHGSGAIFKLVKPAQETVQLTLF